MMGRPWKKWLVRGAVHCKGGCGKRWDLCKGKNGCSKTSPDDEMHHQGRWEVKKAA
jgi:hypothetical protein